MRAAVRCTGSRQTHNHLYSLGKTHNLWHQLYLLDYTGGSPVGRCCGSLHALVRKASMWRTVVPGALVILLQHWKVLPREPIHLRSKGGIEDFWPSTVTAAWACSSRPLWAGWWPTQMRPLSLLGADWSLRRWQMLTSHTAGSAMELSINLHHNLLP